MGLRLDAALDDRAGLGDQGDCAGTVDEIAALYGLGLGTDSCRCMIGMDDLVHNKDSFLYCVAWAGPMRGI